MIKKVLMGFSIILFILILSNCAKSDNDIIKLGSITSNNYWIYLCGLNQYYNTPQEITNRAILDKIGKELGVTILAIKPNNRCKEFNNKLCWPHQDDNALQQSYKYILQTTKNFKISGYIGFSNGGFFLNKLAQTEQIDGPIISIGSAGYIDRALYNNKLYLVIGDNDIYHYKHALAFKERSKLFPNLNVQLVEHTGGHEIPENEVMKLIQIA